MKLTSLIYSLPHTIKDCLFILLAPNFDAVFDSWKSSITSVILSAVTRVLLPILILIAVIYILFTIARLFISRRRNEQEGMEKYIWQIVVCAAAIALFATFTDWGNLFIGG